jgi:hypothetical protein
MIDHPRLTETEAEETAIAVTLDPTGTHRVGEPSRKTFRLSTRAAGLLVDELEYTDREEVAPVTVRTLLLTGGIYLPDQKVDRADVIQRLRSPDGGKHPTDREIECVATYLKESKIPERLVWLAEELVAETRLSETMTADDVRTRRDRLNDLRGIAKKL